MSYTAPVNLEKIKNYDPEAVALAVETLLEENSASPGGILSGIVEPSRPLNIDLVLFYTDILISAGELNKAGHLVEQEVRKDPSCLPLLMRLGKLDEARDQYFNAYDLYRNIGKLVSNSKEKGILQEAIERVKRKIHIESNHYPDSLCLKIKGNTSPLYLSYDLKQQKIRRALLNTILSHINPGTVSILEVECDTGLISRNLAGFGFKTEGTASNINDILLAIGFETAETIWGTHSNPPAYFQLDFDPETAKDIDQSDVLMVLPASFNFYSEKGIAGAAALLKTFARKARYQLFYYIPPGSGLNNRESSTAAFRDKLFKLLKAEFNGGIDRVEIEQAGGTMENGYLYRIDKKKCPELKGVKIVPEGLEVIGTRSSILDIETGKCRVLRRMQNNTADHSTAEIGLPWEEEAIDINNEGWVKSKNEKSTLHDDTATNLSLRRNGYLPELFPRGYIEGYLLKNRNEYRFIVTDGKKRLYSALDRGQQRIRCKIKPVCPTVVDIDDLSNWPGVLCGYYSKARAREIFESNFHDDCR